MESQYNNAIIWLEQYPQLYTLISLCLLIIGAWLANWVVKRLLIRGLVRVLQATPVGKDQLIHDSTVISRLANIVPALILSSGIGLIPGLSETWITIVRNVCGAFIILTVALAITQALMLVNSVYERRPKARV